MKRFLKEMIGIMGLTMFVSSQSPVIAAEASSAKLLAGDTNFKRTDICNADRRTDH